jgi:hypothetical protein
MRSRPGGIELGEAADGKSDMDAESIAHGEKPAAQAQPQMGVFPESRHARPPRGCELIETPPCKHPVSQLEIPDVNHFPRILRTNANW